MHECLKQICKEFETVQDFFTSPSLHAEEKVDKLFINFMLCFSNLKEEKLQYPKEFQHDVKLYNEGFEPLIKKFQDREIRYLMLSDFYDYARLTKKYKK